MTVNLGICVLVFGGLALTLILLETLYAAKKFYTTYRLWIKAR